jgi:peptide/nickel transport system substrate-binding protein
MSLLMRRLMRTLALVLSLALLAGSCGDDDGAGEGTTTTTAETGGDDEGTDEGAEGEDEEEPQYGGKLVVALEAETNNWLPGKGSFASSGVTVAMAIYDPLIVLNGDGEWEPNLAESLEPNDDLTEWTMTLRPGVVFHDGTPFDADALKWNFDTLHNVPESLTYGTIQSTGVTELEVVDDLTVVWHLEETNAAFPDLLRGAVGWPTSPAAYEELGPDALSEAPVGTGPFVFKEWRRDDRFVATRNPDYWRTDEDGRQLPYLDEVEYRPIPDEDSRTASLEADTVQVVSSLRGSTIKDLLALVETGNYGGNAWTGNTSGASILNTLVPPVDDVRIRRAMAYAIDPESVAVVLGDDGLVPYTTTYFSEYSPWFSEAASAAYPGAAGRDVEAGKALVEEYRNDPNRSDGRAPGDPIEVTYNCPPDPSLIEVSQLVQQSFGDIGIEVRLETVEQATHIANAVGSSDQNPPWSGTYMINCWRIGAGEGDPLSSFQSIFGDPASTPGNFTNWTHPEILEQLEILKTSVDFEERYAAAERINIIANENAAVIWGVGTPTYVAWRGDVRGIATWKTPSGSLGNGTVEARVILHQAWIAS